jgi:hypothetical protein
MPGIVVKKITEQAHRQGYTRGEEPTLEFPEIIEDETNDGRLPEMMTIDGRDDARQEPARDEAAADADEIAPPVGESVAAQPQSDPPAPELSSVPVTSRELRALRRDMGFVECSTDAAPEQFSAHQGVRWSRRLSPRVTSEVLLSREKVNAARVMTRRHLVPQDDRDALQGTCLQDIGQRRSTRSRRRSKASDPRRAQANDGKSCMAWGISFRPHPRRA